MPLMLIKLEKTKQKKKSTEIPGIYRKNSRALCPIISLTSILPKKQMILIHRSRYIRAIYIHLGQFFEKVAEACNNAFSLISTNLITKILRISCNRDVLNRLLLSSDPILT